MKLIKDYKLNAINAFPIRTFKSKGFNSRIVFTNNSHRLGNLNDFNLDVYIFPKGLIKKY